MPLVVAGAVASVAVAWAAAHSGSVGSWTGQALGRLDGAVGVLFVAAAALAQRGVTSRALAGNPVRGAVEGWRRRFRDTLVPWWLVVTVAMFLYPVVDGVILRPPRPTSLADAASLAAAESASLPSWIDVVQEWLLVASFSRPDGVLPSIAGPGRLGLSWVVTTLVVVAALLPLWERVLRRASVGRDPVRLAVAAGAALAAGGLLLRVVLSEVAGGRGGWSVVAGVSPPAQLDLLGVGIVVGALVAAARHGRGPLVGAGRVVRIAAPRLGGVVALALLVGAAGPGTASTLDPGGPVSTVVGRVGLGLVGASAVLWGLLVEPATARRWWSAGATSVRPWARRGAGGAFLVIPLVAELWVTRAGGAPFTQRLGPMVMVTLAGSAVAGLALAALGRAVFGPDLRGRLTPFSAALTVITVAGLAWRLVTLVSINRTNPSGGDPFYYHYQANMLADRVGYSEPFRWVESGIAVPSAIHPPLLSTWLGAGSLLGARTFLAHKTLTAVLAVVLVVLAALVARRLAGDRAALITAVVVAAYPNLWVIDGALWPEGVYTTMIGLTLLAAYRWWERPSLGRAAALGVTIALAALARGEALFLFPLLVAPLVLVRRGVGLRGKVAAGAVAGACGVLLLAPWTVRTAAAFDQFVVLSTNSDEVLYYANCADSYGLPETRPVPPGSPPPSEEFLGYWSFNCQERERARAGLPVADAEEAALYRRCLGDQWTPAFEGVVPGEPPGNEAEKARYWRCLGLDYARQNVDRLPVVVAARIGRELGVYRPDQSLALLAVEGRPEGVARVGQLAWWALAPVGLAGWVVLRRRRMLVYPLVSLGIMVLVTTVYAYGAVRFRTPLELALLIGAGVAIDAVWRRWRSGDRAGRPAPSDAGASS